MIVTAANSSEAAVAVKSVRGRVTSDLWSIDAVGAVIPADKVGELAKRDGIRSLVENKQIKTAGEWNGWVSDLRINKGAYSVTSAIYSPPAHLPNGGFAQITESGELLIVNPDGSEKKRVKLTTGGPFYSPAVAAPNGMMYVGAVYGCMYGISAAGEVVWTNSSMLNSTYFYAPPVIASDGTVVAVTYYGVTYGFDPSDGTIRWTQSIGRTNAEYKTAPILGPDDTMYVSSDQGDVFAISRTGGVKWSATLGGGANKYTGATPVLRGGTLYVNATAKLAALDAATGAQKWAFMADSTLLGSPVVAPDGNIVTASTNSLYAINTLGQLQWTAKSTGNIFSRPPLVSPDNANVYVAAQTAKGKNYDYLLGFNRASGAQKWSYQVADLLASQTILDPDGGILFAGKTNSFYRVGPDGTETHRIKTESTITDLSQASEGGSIVMRLSAAPQLIFAGRLPNQWNGRKDVEPGSARNRWKLVNPFTVDIGADTLHKKYVPGTTNSFIQGTNVVVAVVDSGVYWDIETKQTLGVQLQHQFQGQADFVDKLCGATLGCVQNPDHAFFDYNTSRDGYGHGTHVAGTLPTS